MRNPEVDYQHKTPCTEFIKIWKMAGDIGQRRSVKIPIGKLSESLAFTEGRGDATVCVFKIHPLKQ